MDCTVCSSKRAFWMSIPVQLKASTELTVSLVSQRDEEVDQVSAIEAQKRFGITAVTGHVLTGRQKGGKCNR